MSLINKRSEIEWTPYLATAFCEGFGEGTNATPEEQIEAWAYLIKTGTCWSLQGWFGRAASNLMERNLISTEGIINWELLDELNNEPSDE